MRSIFLNLLNKGSFFYFLFFMIHTMFASANNDILIITEVADPSDEYKARFVELFNPNSGSLDFQTQTWYLCRQSNGTTWQSVQLTGSIDAGENYIVAYNETQFISNYGFTPDKISGIVYGNGDDGYFLFKDGNYASGTLIDSYGVIDQDGTGENWEYTDSKASRRYNSLSAKTNWDETDWVIRPSSATTKFTPGLYRDTISWNGGSSADWNSISNWDDVGAIDYFPDIALDVIININASNFPSVPDTGFCHNLILQANANETAVISNHENILIDGKSIVELFVSGGISTKDDPNAIYHFVSPPIDSSDVIDVFPSTTFVRSWKEETQEWESLYSGNQLYSGMAYSCWLEGGSSIVSFSGNFVNDDVSPEISYSPSVSNPLFSGYNLVGNPFPSSIDWDEGSWIKSNIDASIAIWSEDNGGYIYWNGSIGNISNGIIPACQGFFVKANNMLPSIVIPLDSRVNGNDGIYDNTIFEYLSIKVIAENEFSDETFISFNPNATLAYDSQFDAQKLAGLESAPNIFCRAEDNSVLAINTIPVINQSQNVNIEFVTGSDGDFILNSNGMETFADDIGIMLEDLLTGNYIDLRLDSLYNFSYHSGSDPFRFILHFTNLTVLEEYEYTSFNISVSDNNLMIETPYNADLFVFSLSGQKLFNKGICKGDNQISLSLSPGIYILKLIHHNISYSQKIRLW